MDNKCLLNIQYENWSCYVMTIWDYLWNYSLNEAILLWFMWIKIVTLVGHWPWIYCSHLGQQDHSKTNNHAYYYTSYPGSDNRNGNNFFTDSNMQIPNLDIKCFHMSQFWKEKGGALYTKIYNSQSVSC